MVWFFSIIDSHTGHNTNDMVLYCWQYLHMFKAEWVCRIMGAHLLHCQKMKYTQT